MYCSTVRCIAVQCIAVQGIRRREREDWNAALGNGSWAGNQSWVFGQTLSNSYISSSLSF